MKIICWIICLLAVNTATAEKTEVYFDALEKKYALKDGQDFLTAAEYYHIMPFTYDWTPAAKAGSFDILHKSGKTLVEAKEIISQAGSGIICKKSSGQFIFIDLKSGSLLEKACESLSFKNEQFLLYKKNGAQGLLRIDGKVSLEGYDDYDCLYFGDEFLTVARKGSSFYLFDRECKPVLQNLSPLQKVNWCSDNPLYFTFRDKEGKEGIASLTGELTVEPLYEKIVLTKNIYAYLLKKDEKELCGANNINGDKILKASEDYYLATPFHKDGMIVFNKALNDIIVSANGVICSPPCRISGIADFSYGIIQGYLGNKRFLLSSKGEVLLKEEYIHFSRCGKLILAESEHKSDLFTIGGKLLVRDIDQVQLTEFCYIISRGGLKGIVSFDFSCILPPENEDVRYISKTLPEFLALRRGGLWGVYNLKRKKRILPFKFEGISSLADRALVLKLSNAVTVTNLQGDIIVSPASFSIEKISGNYGVVHFQGRYGIVDSAGFAVIKPQIDIERSKFYELLQMLTDNFTGKRLNIVADSFEEVQNLLRKALTGVKMEVIPFDSKTYVAATVEGIRKDLGNGGLKFYCRNLFTVGKKLYSFDLTNHGRYNSFYRLNERCLALEREGSYYFINSALVKSGPFMSLTYNRRDGICLYGTPRRKGVLSQAGERIIKSQYSNIIFENRRYRCENSAGKYKVSAVYSSFGELILDKLPGKVELLADSYFTVDNGVRKYLYGQGIRIIELASCEIENGKIKFLKESNIKLPLTLRAVEESEQLEKCPGSVGIQTFEGKLIPPKFKN